MEEMFYFMYVGIKMIRNRDGLLIKCISECITLPPHIITPNRKKCIEVLETYLGHDIKKE